MARFQRRGRSSSGRGGQRSSNKKSSQGGSKSTKTTTSNKSSNPNEVKFDIGDAKHAANVDQYMKSVVHLVRNSDKYGDYRQEIATAFDEETIPQIDPPNIRDSKYINTIDKAVEPSEWESAQDLIRIQYQEDLKEYNRRKKAYEDNTRALSSFLYLKCTQALRNKLTNKVPDMEVLYQDCIEMKKAIRTYATSYKPDDHPLMQVIEGLRTLLNIRQADDMDTETYGKKLKSAMKIVEERLGCIIVPVKYMTEQPYHKQDTSTDKLTSKKKAWTELCTMIGVLGVNDIKYKSMKEELRRDFSKTHDNYPKDIAALKIQLEGRKWDAVPKTNTQSHSNKSTKQEKEAKELKEANIAAGAVPSANFYQKATQNRACHCCGSKNHFLKDCDKRANTPKERWYQQTGTCLFQEIIATPDDATAASTITAVTTQLAPAQQAAVASANGATVCQLAYDAINLLNGEALKDAVLLDNQSTVHIFKNANYLKNIRLADHPLALSTNGGVLDITQLGDTNYFGTVWYDPRAITNVLSFHQLRKLVGPSKIGYDVAKDSYWVHMDNKQYDFQVSPEGLYYYLPKQKNAVSFLELQDETRKLYTPREYKQAIKARKLLHAAGHPNPKDLVKMIQANQIAHCPVRKRDFDVAAHVLGPDISSLKGKSTRKKPIPVVQELVDLPKELDLYKDVELCVDIVYVNKIPFLTTISRKLQYRTCNHIKQQGTKSDSFLAALDDVLRIYNKNGYLITTIFTDQEFIPLLQPLQDEDSVDLNPASAKEHVPEIERSNRVIKERVRACYHRLPFKQMPKAMVIAMVEDCTYKTNFFPLKSGVSPYFSPRVLVERKQLDFELHLQHAFGDYVQAPMDTTNTPAPRMMDCIYLSPTYNAQGGHILYNLHTKAIITRNRVVPTPISNHIIQLVHELGAAEGMTHLTFQTKHKRLIWDSSLIAGVDYTPDAHEEDDDDEDWEEEDEEEDDESLQYDSDDSVADDDIDDEPLHTIPDDPAEDNQAEDPPHDSDDDASIPGVEQHAFELDQLGEYPEEEVILEPEEEEPQPALRRSERESHPPERLTYSMVQARSLSEKIHSCFVETYSLHGGLKKFGDRGYASALKEIGQMHGRGGLQPTHLRDLTDEEARRALEAVTIMLEKKDGTVKTRTCANGSVQKNWMTKEDVTSPTAATESVILTAAVDAKEKRFVATADIPNAFIQTGIEPKPGEPRIVLIIRGILVDMLCEIAPEVYTKFVEYKNGKKVLYLIVSKAIYGMIQSPFLWYSKLKKDLEEYGFVINPYDPCVANKMVNGSNLTVVWHVDDLKISHVQEEPVEDFLKWLNDKYSDKNGTVTVRRGKVHPFLGMVLDYSEPDSVKIDMIDYVKKMLQEFEEIQKIGAPSKVPWTDQMFVVDDNSPKLDPKRAEQFHTFVAKALFLCARSRPDIKPIVVFLCTRVKAPTEQDWSKLIKMMKMLKGTAKDVLTLTADNLNVLNWHFDASFAVHQDYKSHSGGSMTMGRGAFMSMSKKQKLNTKSSTEAELVAVDDGMGQMLWTKLFLEAQGLKIHKNILHQDNKSAILLEKNGKASSSKRTRHLNIRYFFITDQVSKGNVSIVYCPTDDMIADYFTKPTTGLKFQQLRRIIMNLPLSQCEDTGEQV